MIEIAKANITTLQRRPQQYELTPPSAQILSTMR